MIRVAILTASDKGSTGEREDKSAAVIRELVQDWGDVVAYGVTADERLLIADKLREFCTIADIVFTTGGTGFSPRDVTPEATRDVIEREVPGLPEAMRAKGLKSTPMAMLSRAVAGIRGRCLIVNLPGSPRGVRESLTAILPALGHGIEILRGEASECAGNPRQEV